MARAVTKALPGLPATGGRFRIEPREGHVAIVRLSDGAQVGTINAACDGETLVIRAFCVDEPNRGYGAGSEAAWLLLEAARGVVSVAQARSAPHLGLSVYFWTRMGFHPLHGPEADGGIWFERRL
jgi:hypothetical protein